MLNPDDFKTVNDQRDPTASNATWQSVAKTLANFVLLSDTVASFGVKSLVITLPSCQWQYGHQVAQQGGDTAGSLEIRRPFRTIVCVTISIRVAFVSRWLCSTFDPWAGTDSSRTSAQRTDRRLRHRQDAGHSAEAPSI